MVNFWPCFFQKVDFSKNFFLNIKHRIFSEMKNYRQIINSKSDSSFFSSQFLRKNYDGYIYCTFKIYLFIKISIFFNLCFRSNFNILELFFAYMARYKSSINSIDKNFDFRISCYAFAIGTNNHWQSWSYYSLECDYPS